MRFGRFLSVPRSSFRASGSTPRTGTRSRRSCRRRSGARAPTTRRASPSRCWRGCTTSSTPSPAECPTTTWREIEARLAAATRAWTDDLRDVLVEHAGDEPGRGRCTSCYGEAFPAPYRDDFVPRAGGCTTSTRIERARARSTISALSLYAPARGSTVDRLRFKVVRAGRPIQLSVVLPVLENLGFKVIGERPYAVRQPANPLSGFTTSSSSTTLSNALDPSRSTRPSSRRSRSVLARRRRERQLQPARPAARASIWRQVTVLRGRCASTSGRPACAFSQAYMEGVLAAHPGRAARLRSSSSAFDFDPRGPRTRTQQPQRASRRELNRPRSIAVASLDDDRILRAFLERDRADPADELLPGGRGREGEAVPLAQARPEAAPGPPRAAADIRGLRLLAAGRGRSPARREDRPRRHPLVRPARGLPHRGARPDEGAAGEEHRDRARRREGRLRGQAAAGRRRPSRAARRGRRVLPDLHVRAARHHRQHRRGRASCRAARRRPARRGRPLPRRRGRQGHGDVLRHRQRALGRVRLLARRRVRVGRLGRLRPQEDGASRPAVRGSRCKRHFRELGIDVADHGLHRRRDRRHVRRRVRQRHAALAAHQARRRLRPPALFLDPNPDPEQSFARTRAPLRAAALVAGTTTTRR